MMFVQPIQKAGKALARNSHALTAVNIRRFLSGSEELTNLNKNLIYVKGNNNGTRGIGRINKGVVGIV